MRIFLSFIKLLLILIVSILIGTFLYTLSKSFLVVSAQSIMAVWMISFIFALITKSNYGSRLFLFDLLLGTILVSFYPFSQGLFIILLILIVQKIFKML